MAQGIKEISTKNAPGVKGGQKGGKVAATKSSSAAAIAKILAGISLPINKSDLLKIAHKNKTQVKESDKILDILDELPEKTYHKITNIEIELGKLR
jgi:hypothetical protein